MSTLYSQRYHKLSSGKHKQIRLGVTAPLPQDFVAVCEAAGLRNAIPVDYLTGAIVMDGEQVPLDKEIAGLGGRWLPDS